MPIHTHIENEIAEIIFEFPPVNAFNSKTWNDIPKVINDLGLRSDVKVILIRSKGKGFCAGVDIKELADDSNAIVSVNEGNFLTGQAIHHCEIPVIVAAHKFIIGGGVIMCGAADIVIASDDAYFALPEIDRGAMGGASHLQRMLGVAKVRSAFLTGGNISADEAYRLGGIEKVVPYESLLEEALNYAHILTKKSRVALRIAKKALNGIEPFDVDTNYRWEQGFTYEMYLHEDSQKARDAFVETGNLADYRKK